MGTHNPTRALALICAAMMMACSSNGNDGSPTPNPNGGGSGGGTGTVAATITITATGVSPKTVTVPAGSRVMFVNNDGASHDVSSDPHPVHTDCPDINLVGFLSASQSRATGNLNTARVCGFHDHDRPTDDSLRGTITIQ
jgi:plastocyanin